MVRGKEIQQTKSRRPEHSAGLPAEPTDFRLRLQNEFLSKCRANPRYSLRAFAKFLQTDPSTLSQILRGKRSLTHALVLAFGTRLGLGPMELAGFLDGSAARKSRKKGFVESSKTEAKDLTLDAFQVIADWYHYAIFELTTVSNFKNDPRWIAKTLGITATEVNCAVERLIRLGLIQVEGDGSWKQGSELITTTGNPFTAVAFRKLQAQVINMALKALEEVPIEVRDQTSMTMAINSSRIPEAKEKIKKFRRELCAFLQQDADRDGVYQLGVSFYPLTHIESRKKEEKLK